MEMREYVDTVVSQIRSGKARAFVADEIYAHLEDQRAAYEEGGMAEKEAEREAVRQMGDPVEIGVALDRIHRPRMDYKALLAILALSVIGMIQQFHNVYLQSMHEGAAGIPWEALAGRAAVMAAGMACMFVICFLDYTFFYQYAVFVYFFLAIFSWIIRIVYQHMQHSGYAAMGEYIYLFLPVYGALLYKLRGCGYRMLFYCAGFGAAVLIAAIPVFSSSFVIRFGIAALFMTSFAIIRGWYHVRRWFTAAVLWVSAAGGCLAIGMYELNRGGFRAARIAAILHIQPYYEEIMDVSYYEYYFHYLREHIAGLQWLGNADVQELWQDIMCVCPTDNMNLLYLFFSMGILAGAVVLIVYLLLLGYLFQGCLRQKNELGKMIGFGCVCLMGMEVAGYVLANFGLVYPHMYMTLLQPGSAENIIYYILAGILLSIYRYQDVLPAEPKVFSGKQKQKYRIVFRIEKN